ncbi:MAG TPA: redoxin domain-containing protein, partial [Candidatus Sumerlaeota bacterium]|nr:redoxin domain-containing protein [Candidatus Sumerlaeota bacterium]
PNARQVPSVDALVARGGKTSDDLPAYKLVGELAPDIALPMLSGESFRLSKVEHKQAIMLVFWSSTEKRSNAMLPSMTELTDGLMSSGVALYTINLKESEETIREYMTKQRHQFLVAMDSAGDTVAPYKIGPLPQIVIIDKNNVVRFVHIGLTPKVIIQKELESFIKIVPEDTPKPEKKSSSKKKKSAKG